MLPAEAGVILAMMKIFLWLTLTVIKSLIYLDVIAGYLLSAMTPTGGHIENKITKKLFLTAKIKIF